MDYTKELEQLIITVIKEGGSDLHISEGRYPTIRVTGALIPLLKHKILSKEDTLGLVTELLTSENKKQFLETKEIDFSYSYKNEARFRGNGYFQQGSVGIALRLIPRKIRTLEELNLPPILSTFAEKQQGFFLVVGPVGHGKTTTLAALIDLINTNRAEHIITIEDPIEYIFEEKRSLVDQREVKVDTKDFQTALTAMFRQDVNIAMIGEMRGLETISAAVTAAETGHFVVSTLHTNSAAQTIDRIIDFFPFNQQGQIRLQLAETLTGIFSQRLLPRISGGLVPAYELLITNNAVSNLIREKRTHEINTVIETGLDQGMIDINRSLLDLVRRSEIAVADAYRYTTNLKSLERMM
ncbi:MAG: PilT/PilU family type 4a pilus ATPase [Candidatus Paceibacterota bacterium]|jgi:twitching motility protein PilT